MTSPPFSPDRHDWCAWQPVPELRLNEATLAELLDGGQAFRWWRQPDGAWLGQWGNQITALRSGTADTVEWSTPRPGSSGVGAELSAYLAATDDTASALDALPWRSDPHLATCLRAFPGLRILRQPFGETLLGFLCSATKQIVQIKQMLALLAERLGENVPPGPARAIGVVPPPRVADPAVGAIGCALPTWTRLAVTPEAELRACLLGFRARYIKATAERLAADPGWLDRVPRLPYAEAKAALCELPGVGEKVADCVLLFGAGKLEAFPVDTWIIKAMSQRYGLNGWKPAQIAHFGRVHFGPAAGLAQQYLFAWERTRRP